MSDKIRELLAKQAEDEQTAQLEKFASEVYEEAFIDGWTSCLTKIAEDLVSPGDSPVGNQADMTIDKALELSTGGDPQVIDGEEEAEEAGSEEKTAAEQVLQLLLSKLAEGGDEDEPTADEVEHSEDVATAAAAAQADLQKSELKAAILQQLTQNSAQ